MENKIEISKEFNTIRIIHFAILGGALFFFIIVYFILADDMLGGLWQASILSYLGVGLIITEVFLAPFMKNKYFSEIMKKETREEKIIHFRTAHIVAWAIVEGGVLFNIVIYMLEPNLLPLASILLGILVLYFMRPKLSELEKALSQ